MKFNTVKLGEYLYIKGRIGWKGLKKKEYLDKSDFRIINGESLTENGIDWNKAGYISKERYDESPEIMLQPDDILISKDGTIGKIGYIDSLNTPTTVASGIFVIRNQKPEIINTRFIYHFFCSKYFKNFITMRTEGSVIPHLYQKDFVDLDFPLPELSVQDKIVGILDAICNKIDLNKSINENLYDQMLTIFNNARDTASWNRRKLSDVLTFFDNLRKPLSSIQREKMEHIYPYYGATSIVDYVEDYLFEGTYILVSEDGANVVDPAGHPLTQYTHGKFWVNNHAHIVKGTNGYSEALVYALLGTLNMQSIVTGAAQPKINQANLRNFEAVLPESNEAQELSNILNPMLQQMILNDQENERLSALRDTLLPQLMSGLFDISGIEL